MRRQAPALRHIARTLPAVVLLCFASSAEAQFGEILSVGSAGGANWCKDSGTYCWNNKGGTLSGLRIVGEPKFGTVFAGGENRIESEGFGKLAVIGLETNLIGSFLALQFSVITPGRVRLDDQSPLRVEDRLVSDEGDIDIDSGLALGVSLFDGILTFGTGRLKFDSRDIVNPTSKEKQNWYTYLNVQVVSAVRSVVKQGKPD